MITIPLSSIDTSSRARTDLGDVEGIGNSLLAIGSIHPVVLAKNVSDENSSDTGEAKLPYRLIAGRRRIAGAAAKGITELHHGSILEPGKVGFLFREEVPEDVLKEAELDENLYRLKPKWQEDVVLIMEVHNLKREKFGTNKWGTRQTAELLGLGSHAKVVNAVRIAKLILVKDPDILACENMSHAVAVLVKRKEEEALKELHRRVGGLSGDVLQSPTDPGANVLASGAGLTSFLDVINRDSIKKPLPSIVESSGPVTATTPIDIPLSKMFFNMDFREKMAALGEGTVDHIVTDIPYGIDMKNLDTRDMSSVSSEHDVDENVALMEPFLSLAFKVVRSGGFCLFCYDLDWHEYLQATAESIGWKVQRWPLIIYKTSACQNNAASYNFTKNYECAMVLRKDEKTVLRKQQPTSVWMGDFASERKLYNNAFAKPFDLWKWFYDAIAFPGQSVLDPFCGEMSACRAAINCGLVPYGIEINEKHFLRGLENMKSVYAVVHKSNCVFS